MSSLLSQILRPEVMTALVVFVVLLLILYILSIVWSVRDAADRGTVWALGLLSIIPIAGIVAYCLVRPPLLQSDKEEQELELALKQRELMKYGECGHCGYPVEADYVLCPHCHQRLKNLCPTCHHALEPSWTICPYCTTQIGSPASRGQGRVASRTHE